MQKLILKILLVATIFGIYNSFILWVANKSEYRQVYHFIGVLSGGNLDYAPDVLSEALYQLKWDLEKSSLISEVLL